MRRKIYEKLLKWKNESAGKTCLLVEGARRIGKSYIVEEFAKREYSSYILIDFYKADEDVKSLFMNNLNDLDSFFMFLSAIYNKKLYKNESLIIFDEVQFCPQARAAIKYLVADGRYHFIETGSLLSIKENTENIMIPSEERHLKMYPMDFEEFLWAGNEELLLEVIRNNYKNKTKMGNALHRKAMTLFREYLLVGGMPQAVEEYINTRNFEIVDSIKRDILNLYREDMLKHCRQFKYKVEAIYDEIPDQLSKHEKKFMLSSLRKGAKFRDYEDAFMWLSDSMIVNICYNSSEPSVGLKINRDRTTMKIYMGDTGLLISHAFDESSTAFSDIYKKLLLGKLEVNEGMIFENIVAQMLVANGHKLYFYSNSSRTDSGSRMEIDFLVSKGRISNNHNVSAIEVKSGKNYTLNSLNKFSHKYEKQIDKRIVLHTSDFEEKYNTLFLPVYMAIML